MKVWIRGVASQGDTTGHKIAELFKAFSAERKAAKKTKDDLAGPLLERPFKLLTNHEELAPPAPPIPPRATGHFVEQQRGFIQTTNY